MNMKTMLLAILVAASVAVAGVAVYFVFFANGDDNKSVPFGDDDLTTVTYFVSDTDEGGLAGNTDGWELKDGVLTITMADLIETGKGMHGYNHLQLDLTAFFGKDKVLGNGFYYTVDKDFGGLTKDTKYGVWVMDEAANDIKTGEFTGDTEAEFPATGTWGGFIVKGVDNKFWIELPVNVDNVTYTFHTDDGKTVTLKIVVVPILVAV
jgi:hypothetical protein